MSGCRSFQDSRVFLEIYVEITGSAWQLLAYSICRSGSDTPYAIVRYLHYNVQTVRSVISL